MSCFSDEAQQLFKSWKQDALLKSLEDNHAQITVRRINAIHYGTPENLTAKRRTLLTSRVLRQALLHRADCLLVGSGTMLLAKNIYGLALLARGHLETTAVLAFFCNRIDALSKGNIEYEKFEWEVADAVMGAKHPLFSRANPPTSIMNCIEKGDKFLDKSLFAQKTGLLADHYAWRSEFAHPNFCSNSAAFSLDKASGTFSFRHDGDLQERDFQLLDYLDVGAGLFPKLFDIFSEQAEKTLAD